MPSHKSPKRSRKRELPLRLKLWNEARAKCGVVGVPRRGTKEYLKVRKEFDKLCKQHKC
jgi:hypothetical protein